MESATIVSAVDDALDELITIASELHEHPETKFEERRAAELLAGELKKLGFEVECGVAGLPTAFRATFGDGSLHAALCAEYDALPDIGHACGHDIIAAAAVGAARALRPLCAELDLKISVLGTPGEEGGGGKVLLADAGELDGVHFAMMVHPFTENRLHIPTLAVSSWNVRYRGRAAHASAFPERGINAADALTVAQVAIGLMRQSMGPNERVHGITTTAGAAPNIVPDLAEAIYYIRAETLEKLAALEGRVRRCFEAGGTATGAELEMTSSMPPYSHFEPDIELLEAFAEAAPEVGRDFAPAEFELSRSSASTDMANVSLRIPSIHPWLAVEADGAGIHQAAFADACASRSGHSALRDGAALMALTIARVASNPHLRQRLQSGERMTP